MKKHLRSHGVSFSTGFTLVELLVVISIIAVLIALLFPVFHKARGQSRESVCTSNIHQIAVAMRMYMSDYDEKRPGRFQTVADQYVKSSAVLLCPDDPTGNWGGIFAGGGLRDPSQPPETVRYSYFMPLESLGWSEFAWGEITAADSNVGIVADQQHGVKRLPEPHTMVDYEGLFLTARMDGSVQRRQVHWKHEPPGTIIADTWYLFSDVHVPHRGGYW